MGRHDMSQLSYASEKFAQAVYLLAIGEGDVRSRLRRAFFEIMPIQASLLPQSIQAEYESIIAELTKREARYPDQGNFDETIRRMRNSTGAKIAKRIYNLSMKINLLLSDR